jgi:hypothetical protein
MTEEIEQQVGIAPTGSEMNVGNPNGAVSIGGWGKYVHGPPLPSGLRTYENGYRVQGGLVLPNGKKDCNENLDNLSRGRHITLMAPTRQGKDLHGTLPGNPSSPHCPLLHLVSDQVLTGGQPPWTAPLYRPATVMPSIRNVGESKP